MRIRCALTAGLAVLAGCTGEAPRGRLPSAPQIYVADSEDGTISVIDTATMSRANLVELTVQRGTSYDLFTPYGAAVSPRDGTVWVASPPGLVYARTRLGSDAGSQTPFEDWQPRIPDQLVVLDPASRDISRRISVQDAAFVRFLTFDPEGNFVYATEHGLNDVVRIDTRTFRVTDHYDLGTERGPWGITWCGDRAYVANQSSMSISAIEPTTAQVTETQVPGVPWFVECSTDARYLFVSLFVERQILRVERATGARTVIQLPTSSQGPAGMRVTPDGRSLWVCDHGREWQRPTSNLVYVVDIATAEVRQTITVGQGAHSLAFSRDGAVAYVTNMYDRSISIVDTATYGVVRTFPTGRRPTGITVWNPPAQ